MFAAGAPPLCGGADAKRPESGGGPARVVPAGGRVCIKPSKQLTGPAAARWGGREAAGWSTSAPSSDAVKTARRTEVHHSPHNDSKATAAVHLEHCTKRARGRRGPRAARSGVGWGDPRNRIPWGGRGCGQPLQRNQFISRRRARLPQMESQPERYWRFDTRAGPAPATF